jgi:septal ring factor EnvC (AmiA/AmiB activator)
MTFEDLDTLELLDAVKDRVSSKIKFMQKDRDDLAHLLKAQDKIIGDLRMQAQAKQEELAKVQRLLEERTQTIKKMEEQSYVRDCLNKKEPSAELIRTLDAWYHRRATDLELACFWSKFANSEPQ